MGTITMQSDVDVNKGRTHFGNICIGSKSKKICKWKIKVNKSCGSMIIGISSDWTSHDGFYSNTASSTYGYGCYGMKYKNGKSDEYSSYWKKGIVVGIKLDLKQRIIEFYKNEQSQGIAFENIDIDDDLSYKLAICT